MTAESLGSMCPYCHIGKLWTRQVTLASMFEGQPLVIPNTSALVCDMCGETVVDQDMLHRLYGLLESEKPKMYNILSRQSPKSSSRPS